MKRKALSSGSVGQKRSKLNPLRMTTWTSPVRLHEALAINEVSLLRETRLAAKLRIEIDGDRADAGDDLRRRSGLHARRQHRLQSLGQWPDPAAERARAGVDADQRFPAAAMARRHSAASRDGRDRGSRSPNCARSAPLPTSRRFAMWLASSCARIVAWRSPCFSIPSTTWRNGSSRSSSCFEQPRRARVDTDRVRYRGEAVATQ